MALVMSMGISSAFAADPAYSITVTNDNEAMSINGKTYYAYKVFDLTYSGTTTTGVDETPHAYTIDSDGDGAWAWSTLTKNATTDSTSGVITTTYGIKLTPSATDNTVYVVENDSFTEASARSLADALQAVLPTDSEGKPKADGSAVGASETATISLSEAGYYAVYGVVVPTDPREDPVEEVVAAVALTSTDPTASVKPKAIVPTLDKKITKVTEATASSTQEVSNAVLDTAGQAAVAKVGSTVSFRIESVVPDLTGYSEYTFIISDSITAGLDYVQDSFKISFNAGREAAPATGTLVFATGDNPKSFTLTIPYGTLAAYTKGAPIILTYDCVVNDDALTYDYENNTANLEYSSNPYTDDTHKTPDKKTYVIDINLDVYKYTGTISDASYITAEAYAALDDDAKAEYTAVTEGDHSGEYMKAASAGTALANAKFILYRTVGSTTEYYKWANDKVTWVTDKTQADVFITGTDGNFTQQVRGLDKGTYYLLETEAPAGYNLLSSAVEVVISVAETSATTGDTVTYTATYGGVTASVEDGVINLDDAQTSDAQPVAEGNILNNTGTELPSTGGIGTTIFYVVGSILVVAAGVLLITKKRMSREG